MREYKKKIGYLNSALLPWKRKERKGKERKGKERKGKERYRKREKRGAKIAYCLHLLNQQLLPKASSILAN